MQILVKLTTAGLDTGPFMVYSNLNNYQAPAYGPYTKSQMLAGVTITVPNSTTNIRIRSNSKCVNNIFLTLPTTTTSTSTTTTSTSTTSTTTCAPQNFIMQAVNLSGVFSFTSSPSPFLATAPVKIIWRPGVQITWNPGDPNPSYNYTSSYSGDIIIQTCDLSTIRNLNITSSAFTGTVIIQDTELAKLTGLIQANIYSSKVTFQKNGAPGVTSTSLIPPNLQLFQVNQTNMDGDINDLPNTLTTFTVDGNNTLSGNISNIPPNMSYFQVTGLNTLTGDIGDIPVSISTIIVYGNNTLGGSLSGIPGAPATPSQSNTNPNLVEINILGQTTIRGDLSHMNWSKIRTFKLGGRQNQPTPETTTFLSGNLDTLPVISTLNGGDGVHKFRTDLMAIGHVYGYSTISGNINNFPNGSVFTQLVLGGEDNPSTISGYAGNPGLSIPARPANGWGISITGTMADVPKVEMVTLSLGGVNTLSGTLASYLPAPKCDFFEILGNNTLSGDLKDAPPIARTVNIQGSNTIQTYSVTRTWAGGPSLNAMCKVVLTSNAIINILTQADINRLITDLNATLLWQNDGGIKSQVRIRSANQPTGAALTDLATLNSKILLNPGGLGATVFT